uniref:von Willebrand factor A domain containing 5B2 n=1 Tax=Crocodylus porosus TaxID=8502 RepID=A0A7M4EZC9_CROPO
MLITGPFLSCGMLAKGRALVAQAPLPAPHFSAAFPFKCLIQQPKGCWVGATDHSECLSLFPEPHHPHLVIEEGTMTYQEYEAHIRSRRDYVRVAKRDSDGERQVAFVQKRFHKDIFHNPVLMLNFCPEVGSFPTDLQTITREILFLVDRSGSMSGPNIDRIKGLLVAVKSLPSGSLLNIAGFGSNVKPLFPASKPCSNVSANLRLACEHIQKLRADMGGTNLLAALSWMLGQRLHRGYPRQLFLFTDANVSNPGRVIELARRQASTVRCFSFGLGSGACRRLLRSLAKVSRGRAEFLSPGERLQPKLIKSLKKAIEPAVSDITIDWYVPDTMEALLSPNEIAALYPGDRLISYCTLYNIACFRDKKAVVRALPGGGGAGPQHRAVLSRGSAGSVFQSPDEASGPDGPPLCPAGESQDLSCTLQEISCEISLELSAGGHCSCLATAGGDLTSGADIWKRIYEASYIQEQYVLTHCSVSTDRSQDPLSHSSTSSESTGSRDIAPDGGSLARTPEAASQQGQKSVTGPCKALARAALSGRSFSSPHGELDAHRLRRTLEKVSRKRNRSLEGRLDELGPGLRLLQGSQADSNHLLSTPHLDWDMLVEPPYLFSTPEGEQATVLPMHCQVVIHALSAGKPVSWQASAALESLLHAKEAPGKEEQAGKGWDKLLHRLTARSVIRDHENTAQREAELEHSFARRFRLKAMQSSKACDVPSIYTCLVPVDPSTQEALPTALEVRRAGRTPGARLQAGLPLALGVMGHPLVPAGANQPPPWQVQPQPAQGTRLGSVATVPDPRGRAPPRPCCPRLPAGLPQGPPAFPTVHLSSQVRLQQAPGTFQLTESFAEAVQIPLDRLRRASPYASHRASLSPASCPSPGLLEPGSPQSHSTCSEVLSMAVWPDSGRGSETDAYDHSPEGDLESASWATAVALAWLEHRCAGFFVEWELAAAKADAWLRAQQLPEGVDMGSLRGAARHLFLLLRHWDENIQLNMLCYSPGSV